MVRLRRAHRDATRSGPVIPVPPDVERRRPELRTYATVEAERRRGRGTNANPDGRYEPIQREAAFDGWDLVEEPTSIRTEVTVEKPRTIIARNDSPDISFDRSINPYRGCEHGCVYCFARPSHAYQGLSPGLDFETRLFAKPNAAELLRRELAAPGYRVDTMALGTNTDPYQPIEKQYRITRSILEVLSETDHPVGIVTKSALVARDIDILAPMAARGLAKVAISVTTLDPKLARRMEPRAATPQKRLATIRTLAEAGIPVSVLVAPVIPALNDHEIESILQACWAAGAREAGYVLLRLPHELKGLVRDWLAENYPDRMKHVLSLVEGTRDGKLYDATWGQRQTGVGPYAWMIGRRFEKASERFGFNRVRRELRTDLFRKPAKETAQLALF
ncbi:PA0069 family radical SAM protein [Enterovirga sp. DB1703]|uniref:PA0069 family radical SAM protein n=2 Tax=Enterovirga aerilata TaxID=2730920 RepID=A0A849I9R6_9HYPH|nr:PA0069 family radical SAM protein [Enterovirga sp. DB1703]